jgi:2-keto-4-pentenoate hydratase/2-oxohepta-3-ene-1,7-dioic acid hydratase in catechol pathway
MKLVTYKEKGMEKIGVASADGRKIYPMQDMGIRETTMLDFIENFDEAKLKELEEKVNSGKVKAVEAAQVEKAAPIPRPKQDVICLGINYMEHAKESAKYEKEEFNGERPYAVYFSKRVSEASADGDQIPSYEGFVDSLDYESELAVIIGKDAKSVKKEDAFDYVFGYTIMNDVSARTIQMRHKQWYFGKSLDGFTPMGPWIVTKDEFEEPPVLKICSRVNGELRQNSCTDLLIFDIPFVIEELSAGMTLKAGTIISMGTPAGVGMGFDPPKFLKPGDVVECEIEGIGILKNTVK